jgi:eukaryotic-like serine/threonine-protein kinase
VETDRNLLFGVLAMQSDLLTPQQFAEACSAWAARKDHPLADLLVERAWLNANQRAVVELLLHAKLQKHRGDVKAGLVEVATDAVRRSLAGIDDPEVQQSLAPPTPPPQGHVLLSTADYVPDGRDRYTLSRLHATGGIGRVWLARDARLGRDVALKELRPERAGQPTIWGRFLREAQVTGQLEHPGIVPVYEMGRRPDDQAPFYTMRFVRGRTLAEASRAYHQRRRRGAAGRLDLRELLTAFVSLCQAVAYAHSRGVLHRDLKPQNVILGDYGEVMLLDWGLAKVTGQPDAGDEAAALVPAPVALAGERPRDETVPGQVLGTPAYMAPEQAEGRLDLLDASTDVYGLGAVLYRVLAGEAPFTGSDTTAVLRRVIHEPPAPPHSVVSEVPRALEAICLKALAKRPTDRYATAQSMADDVKRYLADEPVSAYRDPWTTRLTRWGRRHRTLAASLAVAAVAALAGSAAVLGVQARANGELDAKNGELAAKNGELAEQQAEVEARFALALRAIATFHTGVSEDVLLKNDQLWELRTKLLKEAAGFYADLEKLLADKSDPKSRRLLAEAYMQLAEVAEKIGDKTEAAAVLRKALALRRELARANGADLEARLALAHNLGMLARQLKSMGDMPGALAFYQERFDLAMALEQEAPTDAVRAQVAKSYHGIALMQAERSKFAEALEGYEKARAIRQQLTDAHPTDTELQNYFADAYRDSGFALEQMGKMQDSLIAHRKARAILQKLVEAHPTVADFKSAVAISHTHIGAVLHQTGKQAEALKAFGEAGDLRQQLTKAYPAVTEFQNDLASTHYWVAIVLEQTGKSADARREFEAARAIWQKLADDRPAATGFQGDLAERLGSMGEMLDRLGKPAQALKAFQAARDNHQKLAEANPSVPQYRINLAKSHGRIGQLLEQTGKPDEALAEYTQARDISQKLADADAADTRFQDFLAKGYGSTASVLMQTGKPDEAMKAYENERNIVQRLVDANPSVTSFQQTLGSTHHTIGLVLMGTGKPAEALRANERARDVRQKLADACPDVTEFQSDLGASHNNIGVVLERAGKLTEALRAHERARDVRQKLADADPAVPRYRIDLATSHYNIGVLLTKAGKLNEALRAYTKAGDIVQQIWDANPSIIQLGSRLGDILNQFGRRHGRLKQFPEALAALDQSLQLHKMLADARPNIRAYASQLSLSYATRGAVHVQAGHPAKAGIDLRRAVELWDKAGVLDRATHIERARALALLAGLGSEPKSGVSASEAAAFAEQAVAALREAIDAGWAKVAELNLADFDALRPRDDFRKLVHELAAKTKSPPP